MAVNYIARVAKPGFDADTAQTKDLNFYESVPTFKIVKQMLLPAEHDLEVEHGLSYAPQFMCYQEINGDLFPMAVEDSDLGLSNLNRVGVDENYILFDDNVYPKRIVLFSDVPGAYGYADIANNEDFIFKMKDGNFPQKTIMSSEFNHLKEYQTVTADLHIDHDNTTGFLESSETIEIPHSLGFRPYIVITSRVTYQWDSRNGGGGVEPTDPIAYSYYLLPHDDSNAYGTSGFLGFPGLVFNNTYIYYQINAERIRISVKQASSFIEGYENWMNIPPDGFYWDEFHQIRDFQFSVKLFYNDVDEIYSYIES